MTTPFPKADAMKRTNRALAEPPIRVSAADYERLVDLAEAVAASSPAVSEELLKELDRATVLPPANMPAGVVTMNSEVEFRDELSGKVQRVRLVYPKEADIEAGRVSILTPIGAALIGLSKGQRISWQTRTGERRSLTVLAVETAAVHA